MRETSERRRAGGRERRPAAGQRFSCMENALSHCVTLPSAPATATLAKPTAMISELTAKRSRCPTRRKDGETRVVIAAGFEIIT